MEMSIRVIGVDTCKHCRNLVKKYNAQKVDYEYWDGDDENIKPKLNKMGILDFPVIQIVDNKGRVIHTFDRALYPNGVSYATVKRRMKGLASQKMQGERL